MSRSHMDSAGRLNEGDRWELEEGAVLKNIDFALPPGWGSHGPSC